jgi:tyrosinase
MLTVTSLLDPLFFLHHANMDRIWWTWELSNRKARTQDIAGPSVQFTAPFDFFGPTVSPNITLDYVMNVRNFVPEGVAIKDVMDIQQGILCYGYDKLAV